MDLEKKKNLESIAKRIRIDIINMICKAGSGHPGGSLSIVEIITYLYFSGLLNIDPKNPNKKDRDRVVLSKGHACPALYAALAEKGYFDKSELNHLRKYGSMLQGHPDMRKTPGIDISTGSLGQGLSCAVGMALGAKLDNLKCNIFAIIGDGESQEGQIWEAAMSASHYKLGNLIAILDKNGLQIDGFTKDVMNIEPILDKWESFGWEAVEIKGHDFNEIDKAMKKAISVNDKPFCIIADTVKGKGISFMENRSEWHGGSPTKEQQKQCFIELG